MKNLFTYGTLMCEEIMHAVTRHHLSSVSATLNGYARRSIKGEVYPAITPDSDGRVKGMVYLEVPQDAWKKLDEYEGSMYSRERVVIELEDGSVLQADTYIIRALYRNVLTGYEWDYEYFLRHSKRQCLLELK